MGKIMKKLIIKALITKNGYFDRNLLIHLLEKNNLTIFVKRKLYKTWLKAFGVQY